MDEFELTYLAKELPKNLEKVLHKEMLDIYIPSTSEHPNLRIRKAGNKYEITKKEPVNMEDRSHQLETTIPLREEEFAEFEKKLSGKRVEKTRYFFEENGIVYEIDVFRGDLAGLALVDVEFGSKEKKDKFEAPDWCGPEVTQQTFIAGGMLCGKKYSDIETELKKFGYKRL